MSDGGSMFIGGGGMDPAAMMVGMAVGSTMGRQMANTMNNSMQSMQQQGMPGMQQPVMQQQGMPPPAAPPQLMYSVVVNGQTSGPYNMNTLAQMVQNGQLTQQSQVWRQGMSEWAAAGALQELSGLFNPGAAMPQGQMPVQGQMPMQRPPVHVYNEKDYYSLDRLVQFGLGTNVAQQMMTNMNLGIRSMHIPGAGNPMAQPMQAQELQKRTQQMMAQPKPQDIQYYAMIDSVKTGPLRETELAKLINDRKVTNETYIWYAGMGEWAKAGEVPAVLRIVALVPPPPPPEAAFASPPPPPVDTSAPPPPSDTGFASPPPLTDVSMALPPIDSLVPPPVPSPSDMGLAPPLPPVDAAPPPLASEAVMAPPPLPDTSETAFAPPPPPSFDASPPSDINLAPPPLPPDAAFASPPPLASESIMAPPPLDEGSENGKNA